MSKEDAGTRKVSRKQVLAWAMYDVANSAFVLIIVTALYPLLLGSYWASDLSSSESTFWLGNAAAVASAFVALASPFLGAWADNRRLRKKLLAGFMIIGVLATAGLAIPRAGNWPLATLFYVIGTIGFSLANVVYDALLPAVSDSNNGHRVSALGFSLGYLGSTLLLVAALFVIQNPQVAGFEDAHSASRATFIATAIWWFVWTIPLLSHVNEPQAAGDEQGSLLLLVETLKQAVSRKEIWLFLLAYFFYIDGVGAVIRMASKVAADLGASVSELITVIIVVQLVGVPFSLLFGRLGQRFGARAPLLFGIAAYIVITAYGGLVSPGPVNLGFFTISPIMLLGILIGVVQGGVQSLSRSFFAQLIPSERASAYFGLYNVIGKGATIVGPLLMGWTAMFTGSTQTGFLALAPLFIIGALILLFIRSPLPGRLADKE